MMTAFRLLTATANTVEIEVKLTADGTVILRELMYPGWTVTVDGAAAVAEASDDIMRSVSVSEGTHKIRWTFKPTSFYVGTAISAVTLFCLLAFVALEARRKSSADSSLATNGT